MRPHSSRPLQYEDGVGGSQRRAAFSGTNTGNRRAGKRRHGKKRSFGKMRKPHVCFRRCAAGAAAGREGYMSCASIFAQAREATAVASASLATMSGEKDHGLRVSFGLMKKP